MDKLKRRGMVFVRVAELRRQAEEIALGKAAQSSEVLEALSPEETRQTLHELRVHQIELEMQNEELRRAQEELEASRARYFDLYDLAPVGYITLSEQGLILEANLTATQMLGVDRGALVKQPISRFIIPEDQDIYYLNRKQLFETGQPQGCELRILRANADPFWARIEVTAGQDVDGVSMNRITISDVADRKQAEEIIHQMAYHDSLTGLPNRKLFSDRLGIALAQAQRNQKDVAIAVLDLDNFKDVNDALGHGVGDLLLKAAAERLITTLRGSDTVARIGGDEFVLIFPDLKGKKDAIQVIQKIVDSFRKPFLIDIHQLIVTTSIGVAVYPNDGTDEGILLKNADQAMYQAKEAGRNRYQVYEKA